MPDVNETPWQVTAILGLLATLGVGATVRELLKLVFKRVDKVDDDTAISRRELNASLTADRAALRTDIAEQNVRIDTLTLRLDQERAREREQAARYSRLEAENTALRGRYHRLMNYLQALVSLLTVYHQRLGLPESDLPQIPAWIDETIPGPTARAGVPRPPPAPPDPAE